LFCISSASCWSDGAAFEICAFLAALENQVVLKARMKKTPNAEPKNLGISR
jgi:hypothetical protein